MASLLRHASSATATTTPTGTARSNNSSSTARRNRERAEGDNDNDVTDAPRHAGDASAARAGQESATIVIDRLRKSRDPYRELALRAEAALLGVPPRDDFAGIERHLERALRGNGFEMPARPGQRPSDWRREGKGRNVRR